MALTAGTAVGAAVYLKAFPSHSKIMVNGSEARLSDSPVVIQNKLYVPVRDFSEALGYRVGSVGAEGSELFPNPRMEMRSRLARQALPSPKERLPKSAIW